MAKMFNNINTKYINDNTHNAKFKASLVGNRQNDNYIN